MSRVLGEGVSGVGLDVGWLCDAAWPAQARDLARGLIERGHRVHVLCTADEGSLAPWRTDELQRDGVEVRRMGRPEPARALADLVHDARATDVVLAWLAEVPCDVIHALATRELRPSALRAVADMGRPLVGAFGDPGLACACGLSLHEASAGHDVLACARRHWPKLLPSGGGLAQGPDGEPLADDAAAVRALVERARELAALPQRSVANGAFPQGEEGRALVLEHERRYAELVLEITGHLPRLAHPLPGLTPAASPAQRPGWFARLLGCGPRP